MDSNSKKKVKEIDFSFREQKKGVLILSFEVIYMEGIFRTTLLYEQMRRDWKKLGTAKKPQIATKTGRGFAMTQSLDLAWGAYWRKAWVYPGKRDWDGKNFHNLHCNK